MFFVKEKALHTVGIAFQSDGAILQVRKQDFGDTDVVVYHLAFGETGFGIEDFLEVGNVEIDLSDF